MNRFSSGPLLSIYTSCNVPHNSVSGQLKSRSHSGDGQADLGLRCPHIPEDTFSQVMAHILLVHFCLIATIETVS